MKRLSQLTILFLGVMLIACSKKSSSPPDALAGTWSFTNQITQSSFPVPSLIGAFPSVTTTFSAPADSIRITFDGNGNYTFLNFHLPADKGTYIIVKDSLLVIHPDTADLVKFNYTMPVVGFSGTVPAIPTTPATSPLFPAYAPYTNFHFVSDTILFKKTGDTKITFTGTWVTTQTAPVGFPTNDTLVLNQCMNAFIRQ